VRRPAAHEAWIGLGTNLGDRDANLSEALQHFGDAVVSVSPVFETEPWGIKDQPWFLNAVARLHWTEGARVLLNRCLAIERALGRVRAERNGPRIIDIDVLVCGPGCLDEPGLQVPHPGIASRRSVLDPWVAVAPELEVPGTSQSIAELERVSRGLDGHASRRWTPPGS